MTTPSNRPLAPKHVAPGGGAILHGPGDTSYVKLAAGETDNRLSFTEYHVVPGAGPPLHVHTLEDETFYILEGTISFHVGGNRIEATPGTTLFGPRNVPHCFKNNTGRIAKMILVVTPPKNFEDFYAAIGRPVNGQTPELPIVIERIGQLAPRHGLTILGPNPL
ncbi:MAG: cupin domain-containing protein [Phycisphaerales bacterium]|jgi:quercetin dioxygenase-like cupin family protein|nr:cupin domain-containing protein [Phycisphaerales bacterium]